MIKQNILFFILSGLFLFSINTNVYVNSSIADPVNISPLNSVDVIIPTRNSHKELLTSNTYHLSTQEFYSLTTDISILKENSPIWPGNENSLTLDLSLLKEETISIYSS